MNDRSHSPVPRLLALGLATTFLCLSAGCGKREDAPPAASAAPTSTEPSFIHRQAMIAIDVVESTIGGMQDGGGFQAWTAEKVATQIVPVLNTMMTPEPGEPRTPGPKFKYVSGPATGPWQVSIEVVGDGLLLKAYGPDTVTPLHQKTLRVSQY